MNLWLAILIIIVAVALAVLITFLLTSKHDSDKVSYMMDALEDKELNFHFRDNSNINRALNRFRGITERQSVSNEAASWSKLFRVMTHEIMNTVSPIASLSDALSKNDSLDVKAGLETIAISSKDLIRFVESYRNFTSMTRPIRKAVMVNDLIDRVVFLNQTKTAEQNVSLSYTAISSDLLIYADEGQIMQIFNNLIKNAIQANATLIRITAELNADDYTIITVTNNGRPIPREKTEDIFVPFYTTKPNGTGIGLSLSRQIMDLHNGSINLKESNKQQTVFQLIFR